MFQQDDAPDIIGLRVHTRGIIQRDTTEIALNIAWNPVGLIFVVFASPFSR